LPSKIRWTRPITMQVSFQQQLLRYKLQYPFVTFSYVRRILRVSLALVDIHAIEHLWHRWPFDFALPLTPCSICLRMESAKWVKANRISLQEVLFHMKLNLGYITFAIVISINVSRTVIHYYLWIRDIFTARGVCWDNDRITTIMKKRIYICIPATVFLSTADKASQSSFINGMSGFNPEAQIINIRNPCSL